MLATAGLSAALALLLCRDFADDSARLRAIHERLAPSVVQVEAIVREPTETGEALETQRACSGVVVAPGLVLVPIALLGGASANAPEVDSIDVYAAGGRRFDGSFAGARRDVDAAFVRVSDPEFPGQPLAFAEDDRLAPGDFVASLRLAGRSFGRAPYLEAFLVSAAVTEPERCYLTTFAVSDYLGSPVVALDGRVVGVVGHMTLRGRAATRDPATGAELSSLFAPLFGEAETGREVVLVPAERLRRAVAEPFEPPAAPPPWLGVDLQVLIPELREALALEPGVRGVLLTRILPESPAERAGLAISDLVVAVDGQELADVAENDGHDFRGRLSAHAPGDTVVLSVRRGAEAFDCAIALAEAPPVAESAPVAENDELGLRARDLVYMDRADLDLEAAVTGAVVTSVRRAGPLGLAGLQVGDVVRQVAGADVAGAASLCDRIAEHVAAGERELVLFIERSGRTRFLTARLDVADSGR